MKTTFKNLGKVAGMLGCTVLQLIAMILRIISLVFEPFVPELRQVGVCTGSGHYKQQGSHWSEHSSFHP